MQYLLALFGDESGWEDVTPEEMTAGMAPWQRFEDEIHAAGAKIESAGLQPSSTATTVKLGDAGEEPTVTDGPFAETKEQLGGLYLIDVESLDEALEWAKKVPMRAGSSVEVRPVMDYSQFGFVDPETRAEAAS
jgi:hypothetical protein